MKKIKTYVLKNQIRKTLKLLIRIPDYIIKSIGSCLDNKSNKEFEDNLSICVIIKNEADYIDEWIQHHINVGVDKIYIFDNDSTDNTYSIIEPYIKRGIVVYEKISGKNRQYDAYNKALKKYKNTSKYIAFIDADEFLMPCKKNDSIVRILDMLFSTNKRVGGIGVNWRMYGSSGYKKKPKGNVLSSFLYRADDITGKGNDCIKSIVNPRKTFMFFSAHYPIYLLGYYSVDENLDKCKKAYAKPKRTKMIRLNHYFTKSQEEWVKRRNLGKADTNYIEQDKRKMENSMNMIIMIFMMK